MAVSVGASRASGQSKTTLSRRVRELEDDLGVRLIERGLRSLRLTDEGATLHTRTHGPLAEVDEAGLDVAAGLTQPRGPLRVSAPVLFSLVAMGRIAADFIAAFPEVQLEVVVEDRIADLVEDRYDAVIRINPHTGHGLVGRVFFRDELLLVAPPTLERPSGSMEQRPIPAVIMRGASNVATWNWSVDGQIRSGGIEPRLQLSSLLVMRDAVRAGAGAALLPRSLVARDIADGSLVEWGTIPDRQIEGWVLHNSRRLVSPKVRAFVQFLCDAFPDATFKV